MAHKGYLYLLNRERLAYDDTIKFCNETKGYIADILSDEEEVSALPSPSSDGLTLSLTEFGCCTLRLSVCPHRQPVLDLAEKDTSLKLAVPIADPSPASSISG